MFLRRRRRPMMETVVKGATRSYSAELWTTSLGLLVICRIVFGSLDEPTFDASPGNATVTEGRSVVLRCSISRLGPYKVVWLDQRGFALTYEELRVIDDLRFTVHRPFTKEWNLLISDVREEDSGQYRCTVNTDPIRCKTIELLVRVPPKIDDSLSSGDVTTQEGVSVILECHVYGVPKPEVTWYRRLVTMKTSQYTVENLGAVGNRFQIPNVTRYCSRVYFVYECQASNGVPPIARREIRLNVEYQPQTVIANSTIGQRLGEMVRLECRINAFPLDEYFWERDGRMIYDDQIKYTVSCYREDDFESSTFLSILNLSPQDIGEYLCVAVNKRGRSQASATVYVAMEIDGQESGSAKGHQGRSTTSMAIIVDRIKTMEIGQGVIRRRTDERSSKQRISSTGSLFSSTSFQISTFIFCLLMRK